MNYWLSFGEEVKGPFSLHQVRKFWERGDVTGDNQFCLEGENSWTPLSEISHLLEPGPRRWVYILLGLFLGWLGVHNFYAGRFFFGVLQLGLCAILWLRLQDAHAAYPGDYSAETARLGGIILGFTLISWVIADIGLVSKAADGRKMS